MENCTLIGAGVTAEVFAWGDSRVLKLFRDDYPQDSVRQEYENARIAAALDFPKSAAYELIERDGRLGIVYDRVHGVELLSRMVHGDPHAALQQMAALHRQVLACPGGALPDYRDRLHDTLIYASWLGDAERRDALAACRALPEGDAVCHGDFHPGNILIDDGRAVLIDLQDLCRGPAVYDIARSFFLLQEAPPPAGTPVPDGAAFAQTRRAWAEEYLSCMGVSEEALAPYLKVIRASRSDIPH